MAMKMHGRAGLAVTEKGKNREGHGRTMSKKDTTELDGDRTGQHEVAQGLVIKLFVKMLLEHRYPALAKSWLT